MTPHTLNIQNTSEILKNLFYPNPANSSVHISYIHSGTYKIYSITGSLIESSNFSNHYISIEHINSGIYLIQINQMEVQKLIIE